MKNDELIEHHLIHTGVLIGVLNAIPKGGTVEDVETIMSTAMWELLKKGLLRPSLRVYGRTRLVESGRNFLRNEGNKEIGNQRKCRS